MIKARGNAAGFFLIGYLLILGEYRMQRFGKISPLREKKSCDKKTFPHIIDKPYLL